MPSRSGPARLARLLGARIKSLRIEAGLTQETAAWESGVSKAHLSQIEAGRGYPSVPVLALLAKRFGMTILDLVAYDTDDPRTKLLDAARTGDREALEMAVHDLARTIQRRQPISRPFGRRQD